MEPPEARPPRYVPPELCEIIVSLTHPNDLYALARVCRNFTFFAVPRLWQTRTLNLSGDPGDQEAAEAPTYYNEYDEDVAANMDLNFYSGGIQRDRLETRSVLRNGRMPPSISNILRGTNSSGSPKKLRGIAAHKITAQTPLLFDYPSLLTNLNVRYRRVSDVLPLLKLHGHQLRVLDMRGIVYETRENLVAGSVDSIFTFLSTNLEYLDVSRAWVLKSAGKQAAAGKAKQKKGDELAQSLRRAGWVELYVSCLRRLGALPAPPEPDPETGTLETRRRVGTPGLKVLCIGNTIDDTSRLRQVLEAASPELVGLSVDALALNATIGLAGAARHQSAGIELCSKLRWIVIENQDPRVDVFGSLFRSVPTKKGQIPPPSCPELRSLFLVNSNLSALRWLSNYNYENPASGIQTVHVTGDLARLGSETEIDYSLFSAFPQLKQVGVECSSRAVLHSEDFRTALGRSVMDCPVLESFSLVGVGSNKALDDQDVEHLLKSVQSPCLKVLLLPFADRFYIANRISFGRRCFELAVQRWGDSLEKLAIGIPEADSNGALTLDELARFVVRFRRLKDLEIWGLKQGDFARLRKLFMPSEGTMINGVSRQFWAWQVVFDRRRGITGSRWSENELPACVRLGTRAAVREVSRLVVD